MKLAATFRGQYPDLGDSDSEVALSYVAKSAFIVNATLGSGERGRIVGWRSREPDNSGAVYNFLDWKYVSGSTFNLRLTSATSDLEASAYRIESGLTILATGSTVFDTTKMIAVLIELNGTNMILWAYQMSGVNDLVSDGGNQAEIFMPYTKLQHITHLTIFGADDLQSGTEYVYHDASALIECETIADRPDTKLRVYEFDPDGDGSAQDFGDDADCSGTDGVVADVIHSSDAPDESTYVCEEGGNAGVQGFTFPNTFAPTDTVFAVEGLEWGQGNVVGKTVNTDYILGDGSGTVTKANTNHSLTTWSSSHHTFPLDPSGDEWADIGANGMDSIIVDIDSPNTNGANNHHSMLRLIIYETITWDQEPSMPHRRGPPVRHLLGR